MPRKFYKHKLLFDEGIPYRNRFPILNHRFDVKHIKDDLNFSALSDEEVFKLAVKQQRLIITYNHKDFKELTQTSKNTGAIGVDTNLSYNQTDKKLTSLLNNPSSLLEADNFPDSVAYFAKSYGSSILN